MSITAAAPPENSMDFTLYGVIDAVFDEGYPEQIRITHCNNLALEYLGFDKAMIAANRNGVMESVNVVAIKQFSALSKYLPPDESQVVSHNAFLQTLDGRGIRMTFWLRRATINGHPGFRATCTPLDTSFNQAIFRTESDFLKAMAVGFDFIMEIDLVRGCARFVYDAIHGRDMKREGTFYKTEEMLKSMVTRHFDEDYAKVFLVEYEGISHASFEAGDSMVRNVAIPVIGRDGKSNVFYYVFMKFGEIVYILSKMKGGQTGAKPPRNIRIKTFGYFELFVDDKPVAFRHPKAKELLAILVDRRGGFVNSRTAAALMWENEEPDSTVMTRLRKIAMYLKESLAAVGAEALVESRRGERRAVLSIADCDLMDYLDKGDEAGAQFNGAYMSQYSWAEQTLGELTFKANRILR